MVKKVIVIILLILSTIETSDKVGLFDYKQQLLPSRLTDKLRKLTKSVQKKVHLKLLIRIGSIRLCR